MIKSTTIKIDIFNPQSIDNAISAVEHFKNSIKEQVSTMLDAMVAYGESYAINTLAHIDTGETLDSIVGYRDKNKGFIVAGGNAIWLEFGTGVYVSGQQEYPIMIPPGIVYHGEYGKGGGDNPDGWFYLDDKDGKIHHTMGIPANMFMYKTLKQLEELCRKGEFVR